jgi:hypothetical protein
MARRIAGAEPPFRFLQVGARYRATVGPRPDVGHPWLVARNRSSVGLKSAKIASRQMALAE